MKKDNKPIALLILSIAGVLFAGYLSAVKFFTATCAFSESCPYFLGYPACYYGFVMFLTLFVLSLLRVKNKIDQRKGAVGISAVSFLGILFAGHFTLKELPILFSNGLGAYMLGLPTCALGLVFYITIFAISTVPNKEI